MTWLQTHEALVGRHRAAVEKAEAAAAQRDALADRVRELRLEAAEAADAGDSAAVARLNGDLLAAESAASRSRADASAADDLVEAIAMQVDASRDACRSALMVEIEDLRAKGDNALSELAAEWEEAARPLAQVAAKLLALLNAVDGGITVFSRAGVSAEAFNVVPANIAATLDELLVARLGTTGKFDRRDRLVDTDR